MAVMEKATYKYYILCMKKYFAMLALWMLGLSPVYAQHACPVSVNACSGAGGLSQCTSELTAQHVNQTQIFTCPQGSVIQNTEYGCVVSNDEKKSVYYAQCKNMGRDLRVFVTFGFTKPHFNYSSHDPQKFSLVYCCR